jgi:hypothetical protein
MIHHGCEPPTGRIPEEQGGDTPVKAPGSRAVILAWCGFALVLGGCATIANTPQQDLAYERWAKCKSPYVLLEWVEVDGRITFRYNSASAQQEVLQCLVQASRSGPPLPEPVGVRPPNGV